MRLAFVCADRGIALDGTKGASAHVRALSRAFARAGHEVTLFTARAGRAAGVSVAPLNALDGAEADVIYERSALGHDAGLRRARTLGVPYVLEVNAPLAMEAARHRPDTLAAGDAELEARLWREADLVCAVSEPLRRMVAAARATDAGTCVVWNGAESPTSGPIGRRSATMVAFLGHPKPWHGADALPEILARVPAARGVVIGGGPGAEEVIGRAERLGVHGRVEVTGPLPQDEALARLARAAVSIAPYPKVEPFYFCPLKIVESMAAGVPVVASSLGDIPDIVGDAGICVAPGDASALAGAVQRLLDDPRSRRAMGAAGRRRAAALFDWDRVAATILEHVPAGVAR